MKAIGRYGAPLAPDSNHFGIKQEGKKNANETEPLSPDGVASAGLMLFSSLAVLAGCADSEGDATATETGSGVQSGSSAEEETKAAPYTNLERRSTTGNSLFGSRRHEDRL